MQSTEILLIRHGETDYNAKVVIQGQLNNLLNERGRQQARSLQKRFKRNKNFDCIISSDLSRAKETAEIINEKLRLPIEFDSRWREIALGYWEGKSWERLKIETNELENEYFRDWFHYCEHGGESWQQVMERIKKAFFDIIKRLQGKRILLVTHGGAIRLAIMYILNLPNKYYPMIFNNTSISEVSYRKEKWWLKRINDASHLEKRWKRFNFF